MEVLSLENNYWNVKYKKLWDKKLFTNGPVTSEHGEEKIVKMVFNKIKPMNKWFVDVGSASYGKSNTFNLTKEGWSGLLIDENKNPINELRGLIKSNNNVRALNIHITRRNLDKILYEQNVPEEFDFLSIDIDSYDYEVWKNLKQFHPNLVCIEVNQEKIGNFDIVKYTPEKKEWGGATVGLMNELAEEKGYDYLCWIVSNAFYIKKGLYD